MVGSEQELSQTARTEYELRHRKSLAIRRVIAMIEHGSPRNYTQAAAVLRDEGLIEEATLLQAGEDLVYQALWKSRHKADEREKDERECKSLVKM